MIASLFQLAQATKTEAEKWSIFDIFAWWMWFPALGIVGLIVFMIIYKRRQM